MREPLRDKTRLEHILEAIERLEKYAGSLTREELEADVSYSFSTWLCLPPKKAEIHWGFAMA